MRKRKRNIKKEKIQREKKEFRKLTVEEEIKIVRMIEKSRRKKKV